MPISIRRLLFPTDFSEPSKVAQQYAMALAHQFDAELHLLHVVSPVMPYTDISTGWAMPQFETQQQLEAAERTLMETVIDEKWSSEHRVIRSTVFGIPVDQILSYAKNQEIDLIVLGTHGFSGLTHALIGSVAEKLVRLAHCPVLTVHPDGHQFVSDANTANPSSTLK